ncbi:hypothetical protein FXF51_03075 [Nonomuraea sp. PA05]|uniref:hypothetical protein n=1 Tax=Nonomuraea sp. PA05 TaxID=2604466 RepID=UPI0011DC21CC|nr:hypothetical protein [Nonomuraea sp. PA05]TYB70084.1 hypothetical protein FXF51_03075 [Nonomuraea sp. PA05]
MEIVEQGPRGPRWAGAAALLALLAAVPLIVVLTRAEDGGGPRPVVSRDPVREDGDGPRPVVSRVPVREAVSVTPNAVYPAAVVEGGTGTMRVTFPDGSRAEITYPARLSLASLGARPYVGGTLTGDGGAEFRALTAPLYGEAETAAGRAMLRPLTANVSVWPGPPGVDAAGQVLLFRFGDWRLALQDEPMGMTFEQRLAWAANLRGTHGPDGFLTLSAGGPLRLARPGETRAGRLVGPQLWLGGLSRRMLVVAPVPGCGRLGEAPVVLDARHAIAGSACRDGYYLAASGDRGFVRAAVEDVRVRPAP